MLHASPSKKHQPSFEMYSCDSNPFPGFLVSGAGTVHHAQSTCHVSRASFSPHASTTDHFIPIESQQLYSLIGYGSHLPQAPRTPRTKSARSFPLSVGSASTKTPLSLSSHPYHPAKLCHRAPVRPQERSPFSTTPSPSLAFDTTPRFNAVFASSASTFWDDLDVLTRKYPPLPTASQSNIVGSNANQNVPSFMESLAVPAQPFASNTPALPLISVDQSDAEYAQDHYGNIPCFYQCRFDVSGSPCNKWIVGERTRILRHLRNYHHLQTGPATPARCRWEQCTHSRPMKQENLSRHVVMHLGVKWRCPHCRRLFSRDDAVHRHIERTVPGMDVTEAEVVPGREARAVNETQCRGGCIA